MSEPSSSRWEQQLIQYQHVSAGSQDDAILPARWLTTSADTSLPTAPLAITAVFVMLPGKTHCDLVDKVASFEHIDHTINLSHSQLSDFPDHDGVFFICDKTNLKPSLARLADIPFVVAGASNALAMQAFAARAAGFIRCPVSHTQLTRCLQHVCALVKLAQHRKLYHQLAGLLARQMQLLPDDIPAWLAHHLQHQQSRKVTFRSANAWHCLDCESILWVQAAGDYMCIYTHNENYIVRITLADLRRRLCPNHFEQVNRSVLVNRSFVKQVEPQGPQTAWLRLLDGTRLKISRRYFTTCWQQLG